MGHRRFLHKEHKFRSNRNLFNGRNELRDAPKHFSGSDIFGQVEGLNVTFRKPLEPMDNNKRAWGKNVVEVVGAE